MKTDMHKINNLVAKGTIYTMIAQLIAMVSGYLVHVTLARFLGPSVYGQFGVVMSLILITRTVFVTGINRATAKYISEDRTHPYPILRAGIQLQMILIGICFIIYVLFSKNIANIFKDPSLTSIIRYSSVVVLPLGLYAIYTGGYLNGIRNFKSGALVEVIHSIAKLALALILVYVGFGLFGAVSAYIVAPFIAFLFTLKFVKTKAIKQRFSKITLIKFAMPITLFYGIITLTMDLGLLSVKSILGNNILTGFYTSASTLSKIIFSIFLALPVTMLPSISKAFTNKNIKLVGKYVNQSLRYAIMILFPIAVLISAYSEPLIMLLYSPTYLQAAPTLSILVFAFIFFSLFMILCSFIHGANKPSHTMILAAILCPIAFFLNVKLIPLLSLPGAAISMVITSFIGVIMASLYVLIRFKSLMKFSSLLKILFASAIVYIGAHFWKANKFTFIIFSGLLVIVYAFILISLKEITEEDRKLLFSILKLK